jgi:phosphopantothenoylcysteine synthetase/decarboxylase
MNLLIGVTGSSGVTELPLYIRVFREKLNATIKIVSTENVKRFINDDLLAVYSDSPIYNDMYDFNIPGEVRVPHSYLIDWADIFIILPCTANTLNKCATGIADNLLTMLVLCSDQPVFFFPNMNPKMWDSPVVQHNSSKLKKFGHKIVYPSGNSWITATRESVDYGHVPPPYTVSKYLSKHYAERYNIKTT